MIEEPVLALPILPKKKPTPKPKLPKVVDQVVENTKIILGDDFPSVTKSKKTTTTPAPPLSDSDVTTRKINPKNAPLVTSLV